MISSARLWAASRGAARRAGEEDIVASWCSLQESICDDREEVPWAGQDGLLDEQQGVKVYSQSWERIHAKGQIYGI